MSQFKPETIARIENAIPQVGDATSLDIWRASGGLSHQHVKNGLKHLVECGKALRTTERYRVEHQNRTATRYRYQRVQS